MRLSTSTCMYFNRPDGTKASILDSVRTLGQAGYRVLDMNFHDLSVFDTPFKTPQWETLDRKSTRLNSSHYQQSRMPSSA